MLQVGLIHINHSQVIQPIHYVVEAHTVRLDGVVQSVYHPAQLIGLAENIFYLKMGSLDVLIQPELAQRSSFTQLCGSVANRFRGKRPARAIRSGFPVTLVPLSCQPSAGAFDGAAYIGPGCFADGDGGVDNAGVTIMLTTLKVVLIEIAREALVFQACVDAS